MAKDQGMLNLTVVGIVAVVAIVVMVLDSGDLLTGKYVNKEIMAYDGGGRNAYQECTDTDYGVNNGRDIYTKGTAVGAKAGDSYATSGIDYCLDKNHVVEHFCIGEELLVMDATTNPSTTTTGTFCANGCSNGACIR